MIVADFRKTSSSFRRKTSNFLKKAIVFFIPNFNISTISRRGTQVNAMRVRRNSAESIRIQPQDIQQRTLHSHIAYPCLRFRRLIGAYVGDGNHLSRSMCMVVVRRRVRVYNHHTVNDMYVSKHSNAYLVRQKQCQQKQRSQYVPSLTQFLG